MRPIFIDRQTLKDIKKINQLLALGFALQVIDAPPSRFDR